MKSRLSLKTLYRSPVRTVLTFVLLVAVTFALFSQVMEYAIAEREMNKAAARYEGITTLEISKPNGLSLQGEYPLYMFTDERVGVDHLSEYWQEALRAMQYEKLTPGEVEEILNLPYITYADTRYITAGFCKDYPRVDDGAYFYNHTNQCVIEATVHAIGDLVTLVDLKLLGGRAQYPVEKSAIWLTPETATFTFLDDPNNGESYYGYYHEDEVTRATSFYTLASKYTMSNILDGNILEVGKRYAFVLRYDDWYINVSYPIPYNLTDPYIGSWCDAVWLLEDEPENYLETEKFAPLKMYIEMINANLNTLDVVYTNNTHSIRYFSDGTIGISQGRGITLEDSENKANVCLVSHDFALEYDLALGDNITLELGNKLFEQYISNGAIAAAPDMISTETTEVTLEIIGIYKDSRGERMQSNDPHWSYSSNAIFVPYHLLNVDETELANHTFAPGEISFVVDDAWDIPAFIEEVLPVLEEKGYTVVFDDDDWPSMIEDYTANRRLSLIRLSVLAAAVLMATAFVSFLYIVGKRRDYAIMRVLGTSKAKSGRALILPLSLMALVAAAAGALSAYIYTQNTIGESDAIAAVASFDPTLIIDVTIPAWLIVACVLGEIILALFIAFVLLLFLGAKSPLALIQDASAKRKKQRRAKIAESSEPVMLGEWTPLGKAVHDGKKRKITFSAKYIIRHMRRTFSKAILLVVVTALLISVVGQLHIMDNSYNEIVDNTDILINFAGHTNLNTFVKLNSSGYIRDGYYETTKSIEINGETKYSVITNDISKYAQEEVDIVFAEGYDITAFDTPGNVLFVGNGYMELLNEMFGVGLGDTVYLSRTGLMDITKTRYAIEFNDIVKEPDYLDYTDYVQYRDDHLLWLLEMNEYFGDEIWATYTEKSEPFIIAGVVSSKSNRLSQFAFLPGCMALNPYFGKICNLEVTEGYLADNWKDEEFRQFGEALAAENKTGEIAFIMDTSKLENVKNNIKLLETLYPIVIAAILVIGAFLCGLLIVQTSKDIAIMRVLGTSKRRVRVIMTVEYGVLCFIGILLALTVLVIRKAGGDVIAETAAVCGMFFAAVLIASVVASVAASRKNVLELLQTKE